MGTSLSHMDTPDETSVQVASVVAKALGDAGISQREASARTGIPITTLVRRLGGKSSFKVDELEALAGIIGCTITSFFAAAEASAASATQRGDAA